MQSAFAETVSDQLAALRALAPGAAVYSSGLSGPVALKGVVTAPGGRAVGAGVPVLLFAAPSQASLASMKVGDTVSFPLVAATITGAGGAYSFPQSFVTTGLAPTKSEYQMVVVPTLGQAGVRRVNLLAADPVITSGGVQGGLMAATPLGVAPSSGTAVTAASLANHDGNLSLPSVPATAVQVNAFRPAGAIPYEAPKSWCAWPTCVYVTLQYSWNQDVLVAQTQSKTSLVDAQVTYAKGATSTLGVGFSVTGGAFTFKQNGTTTGTSTVTGTYATRVGVHNTYYWTKFVYGRYYIVTTYRGQVIDRKYEVAEASHAGGGTASQAGGSLQAGSPSYCVPCEKGYKHEQTTTTAVTWTNGASVRTSLASVDLSARTGYTTTAKLAYTFTRGKANICGVWGAPGNNPGLVYASLTT